MRTRNDLHAALLIGAWITSGCAGTPVSFGAPVTAASIDGTVRTITAESCGFQLLFFIPLGVNDRAQRAYHQLEAQADGDYITDVQVRERWIWGFVGTNYCTMLTAKAIRPGTA